MMRYLSVCSGIGAASVAWEPLGWEAVAFAEIEKFPRAVLKHHYPNVPNLGDMKKFKEWPDAAIDVLVGGTPCQSFSVAGLRKGLDDPRGNLALVYLAIADRYRPRWVVWENVPGVLSSSEGRDFGSFLGGLAQLGYGWAYRVLDAQYFGLAQRRRRVFIVGYLGDWRRSAAVLFEREGLSGNTAPRREAGKRVAPTISARTKGGGGLGTDFDCDGGLITKALNAKGGTGHIDAESETFVTHSLRADGFDASEDGTGRGTPLIAFQSNAGSFGAEAGPLSPTLRVQKSSGGGMPAVAFGFTNRGFSSGDVVETLRAGCHGALPMTTQKMAVRRLMPVECELLQGFPRDYTLIPFHCKPAADGPQYKALGNSMAVPCMRWIGERIQMVEAL